MKRSAVLGILFTLLSLSGACWSYQYDPDVIMKENPYQKDSISFNRMIYNDLKNATEYNNIFENESIKISMELEYNIGNFYEQRKLSGYREMPLDLQQLPQSKRIFMINNREFVNLIKPAHLIMFAKNKTGNPMEINLSKSIISICYRNSDNNIGYKGLPISNKILKKNQDWILKLAPNEENAAILYPPAENAIQLETDTELLGPVYLLVNGEYINFNVSGFINSSKLHWEADQSLESNQLKIKLLNPANQKVQKTKKEALPSWAL